MGRRHAAQVPGTGLPKRYRVTVVLLYCCCCCWCCCFFSAAAADLPAVAAAPCGSNLTNNTFWNHSKCSGHCCDTRWGVGTPAGCCFVCQSTGIGTEPCALWEWSADAAVCYVCTEEAARYRGAMAGHVTGCTNAKSCAGLSSMVSSSSLLPSTEVLLTPAMDIQRIMDSSDNGTIFTFAPGLYRFQGMWEEGGKWNGLRPPANSVLQAQVRRTAILSGAVPINHTRALAGGQLWAADVKGFADNSTWPPPLPTHPQLGSAYVCEPGWEACCFRQDLFIDDQVVRRTAYRENLSHTTERMWWMDYVTSEALMNFDPASATSLEISWQSNWLRAVHGSNVTVRGLVIEKIANHAQGDPDEAHTVDDCEIRYAHGIGVAAVTVTNSHVHHCGEQGVSAYILIQNNTIEWNNYANYSIGWAAGGVKIFVNRAIADQCT